jgi:hypothetical protein
MVSDFYLECNPCVYVILQLQSNVKCMQLFSVCTGSCQMSGLTKWDNHIQPMDYKQNCVNIQVFYMESCERRIKYVDFINVSTFLGQNT